jgi:prephenate dehydrogenase
VGLIGGSLGQALRRSGKYRVLGIGRHRDKLHKARLLKAIDEHSLSVKDAAKADIVVISTPVDLVVPTFRNILPYLKPGTLVMDVSSVKEAIEIGLKKLRWDRDIYFVGCHPLAGSHRSGIGAARPDLFRGAACVLSPFRCAPLKPAEALWKAAGASTMVLSAEEHDKAVALISHLPHMLAHALVHALLADPKRKVMSKMLAGSFADMTRVASSDAAQWAQILKANVRPVRRAVRLFERELKRLDRKIADPSFAPLLRRSQSFRSSIVHGI